MMRVGEDYQAQIPECRPDSPSRYAETDQKSMLVWSPTHKISEAQLCKYILIAKEKHGYNMEQALGMLFWHKHDVEKALTDLANFTPLPDEWTVENKVLFEQAFSFHGKSFHRIQKMLPDKEISSLVKYYYSWKKTRSRTSVMDRQARRLMSKKAKDERNNKVEKESGVRNRNTEVDSKKETQKQNSCSRGGTDKAASGRPGLACKKPRCPRPHRQPPKGKHVKEKDISSLTPIAEVEASRVKNLDMQPIQRQVQSNKQTLKHSLDGGIDAMNPTKSVPKINSRWTTEEQLLAVEAIRQYGKDVNVIAEVIGKNGNAISQDSSFFVSYQHQFNLEEVLPEWEVKQKIPPGHTGSLENAKSPTVMVGGLSGANSSVGIWGEKGWDISKKTKENL
ncbi:REST corepressor 2-like [Arapaima gigas]